MTRCGRVLLAALLAGPQPRVRSSCCGQCWIDHYQNGDELGVDCGGSCPPCPACDDGQLNGDEVAADCGGSCQACTCTSLNYGEIVDNQFLSHLAYPPDHGYRVQSCHTPSDNKCYVNDTAVYSCHPGYELNGSTGATPGDTRTCLENGTWSGRPVECMGLHCGPPPPIAHGSATIKSLDYLASHRVAGRYPSRVTYACDEGYYRVGSLVQECTTAGDWAALPWIPVTCLGNVCDALPSISHMQLPNVSNGGRYPSDAVFECEPGYAMSGVAVRTCDTDGTWSGSMPSCAGILCDPPGQIVNGSTMLTNNGRFPSTAVSVCVNGQQMDGASARSCLPDGSWSAPAPLCGTPCTNGHSIFHSPTTCPWGVDGRECVYECDEGYAAQGVHKCYLNGSFSGGSCIAQPCTAGLMLVNSSTVCTGRTGDVCQYTCDTGYSPSGSHTCRPDGTFRGGQCVANPCGGGLSIAYSDTICSGSTMDVCNFTCAPGYSKTGTHTCFPDGNFVGGSCMPNPCTAGLTLEHSPGSWTACGGVIREECEGVTTDECTFECDLGYCASGKHLCQTDGVFRGGSCVAQPCSGGFNIMHSSAVCNGTTDQVCDYDCDEGFIETGIHSCMPSGTFEGGTCAPLQCASDVPQHSATLCVGSTGDMCTLECDLGYTATGTHICQPDGMFSGGHCRANHCTSGLTILHAESLCEGTTGDVCEVECDGGYTQQGTHVCRPDGNFTGATCEPLPCVSGNRLSHSVTMCNGVTGDTCEFSCWIGYLPVGTHTCKPDQAFSGGKCELVFPCLARQHNCDIKARATCVDTGAGQFNCICNDGYWGDGRVCRSWTVCMGGQYASVEPTRLIDRQCSACANGTFLPPMSTVTACPSCDAGFADTDFDPATECVKCSPGTYQPGYQQPTVCPVCAPNHYDDDSDPMTACIPCAPGFSSVAGASTCVANVCTQSTVPRSTTICRGATTDECAYFCEEGYAPAGKHICLPNGTFAGGNCAGVPCANGAVIEHSPTDCSGVATAESCEFTCDAGYAATGSHTCLAMGWFQGGSCAPMPCEESMLPNSTRPCTGVMGDICVPVCGSGFGSIGQHECQVIWKAPYPGAPAEMKMVFLGGACEMLPEPEPEPEPEPLPYAPPPPPPSPAELVLSCSTTLDGGIMAESFTAAMRAHASGTTVHVFGENGQHVSDSSWADSEQTWSTSMRVAITRYQQTLSSWLTIASEDGGGDSGGSDLTSQETDFAAGSVERYSLRLALLSTFGVSTPSQVQINKLTPVSSQVGRRRLWSSYHINYTIVSDHDISTVPLAARFAENIARNMYTIAWSYGGVRLHEDGLISAPTDISAVETTIDYELIAPLDLALHSKANVETALMGLVGDQKLLSTVLNKSVVRSAVSSSKTVELSNRTRSTPPLSAQPGRGSEIAAVTIGLLLVLSAAASFALLLYRVCLPAYKGWRVAPVSKYEWAPKDLGGSSSQEETNKRRLKQKVGRQDKWWQTEAKRKEEEQQAKAEQEKLAVEDEDINGGESSGDEDPKPALRNDKNEAPVEVDTEVEPTQYELKEREAASFSAGFASSESDSDDKGASKQGQKLGL